VTTLNRMLWKATSFNQNLCAWGDHIPNFVPVRSMFSSTQCPTTDSPGTPDCWDFFEFGGCLNSKIGRFLVSSWLYLIKEAPV